jgi:glycosyltransferase involved in cell wall biosynthesis
VIALSHFLADIHVQAGIPAGRVVYSPQGNHATSSAAIPRIARGSEALQLTYMGQIAEHKGVHVLIDAMRILPDARVRVQIYGDLSSNPDYVRLLRSSSNSDPRIHWMGTFERTELAGIMAQTDAVVVPSLWYENSPNVIFEAFAHGTPVIATDLGGMAELVQSGVNGLLFPVGDSAALATAIRRIADDRQLLAQYAQHIPPVRTIAQETDELEHLFLGLIAHHRAEFGMSPGPERSVS